VTAARATGSNVVGMMSMQTAAINVQWCVSPSPVSADRLPTFYRHCPSVDQLDKADVSLIPDAYIYPLVCNASSYYPMASPIYLPFLQHPRSPKPPVSSTEPVHAPGTLDPTTLLETEPARARLRTVCAMLNVGWAVLLATHSFLLTVLSSVTS
jgi:hypothetical protein